MGKSKEEDRIEKVIRGLLKLPGNRRCINCNSLGPQYVCTTFWTFVCTNCSGVHREFTHRVKSVSMAKFTSEEVSALQANGNEQAREVYFKTWDPQRNFFPDNSNIHKLRDFIKHVYVERRFTGESHPALVPRLKASEKDEPYEKPSFRERTSDRYSRYSYDEVRSPGYPRENSRYGGFRSGSPRFEGTNGRYQVDDARIAGRSATQMFTTEDIKPRRRSPDRHRNSDVNSPPPVRHVREILGENFLALRVGDQPKSSDRRSVYGTANGQIGNHRKASNRSVDGHARDQEGHGQQAGDNFKTNHRRCVSAYSQSAEQSGSQTSANNAAMKPKSGSAGSLVDFADFPSPDSSSEKQIHVVTKDEEHSASSEPPLTVKQGSQSAPPKNTLEILLFELAPPVDENAPPSSAPSTGGNAPVSISEPSTLEMVPILPDKSDVSASKHVIPATVPDLLGSDDDVSTMIESEKKQSPINEQAEHTSCTTVSASNSSVPQTSHSNEIRVNQTEPLSLVSSAEVALINSTSQLPQPSVGPTTQETVSAARRHPSAPESKSNGRTELPADIFASLYPSGLSNSVPVPGWQMSPSYGMGFNMQYHPASMQIEAFENVPKSTNPFDTNENTPQHHPNMFPLMTSLQGGLPNMSAPAGTSPTSSFGSHLPGAPNGQSPSYASGPYMGQHLYNNMPPSRFGIGGGMPGSLNSNQQNPYAYQTPTNPSSFPTGGGNPFG